MGSDGSELTPAEKAAVEDVKKFIDQYATPAGWAADINKLLGKYSQVSNQLVYYQSQLLSINPDVINANPHGLTFMGHEVVKWPWSDGIEKLLSKIPGTLQSKAGTKEGIDEGAAAKKLMQRGGKFDSAAASLTARIDKELAPLQQKVLDVREKMAALDGTAADYKEQLARLKFEESVAQGGVNDKIKSLEEARQKVIGYQAKVEASALKATEAAGKAKLAMSDTEKYVGDIDKNLSAMQLKVTELAEALGTS